MKSKHNIDNNKQSIYDENMYTKIQHSIYKRIDRTTSRVKLIIESYKNVLIVIIELTIGDNKYIRHLSILVSIGIQFYYNVN